MARSRSRRAARGRLERIERPDEILVGRAACNGLQRDAKLRLGASLGRDTYSLARSRIRARATQRNGRTRARIRRGRFVLDDGEQHFGGHRGNPKRCGAVGRARDVPYPLLRAAARTRERRGDLEAVGHHRLAPRRRRKNRISCQCSDGGSSAKDHQSRRVEERDDEGAVGGSQLESVSCVWHQLNDV